MKEELDRMEKDGVIQKVTTATDLCAPIVPVKKKNGKTETRTTTSDRTSSSTLVETGC